MLTAQELRSKRQQHKLTQAQLAQAVGIEEDLLARYEKGESPIPADLEGKLQVVWRGAPTGQQKPTPTKKPTSPKTPPKTPSVAQWLKQRAQDQPGRTPKSTAAGDPAGATRDDSTSAITHAVGPITNEKQRRAALTALLNAALGQVDDAFVEDKQLRTTVDAVEALQPEYKQVILGLIGQLEQVKAPRQAKGKSSSPEHILQSLQGGSPYETLLNYLQAAAQLVTQADVAEQTPLMSRLQKLNDFDRNTVSMLIKRYQETKKPQEAAKTEDKPQATSG